MRPFINIHSHTPSQAGTITIVNIYEHFQHIDQQGLYSIGLHPWYLHDHTTQWDIMRHVATRKEVAAIGECGLDKIKGAPLPLQEKVFIQHIALANEVGKPLIVHCVRAYEEVFSILGEHQPRIPVIFHGFNKKQELADRIIQKGYYLSLGSALLGDNTPAASVIAHIPADRFFLETDDADIPVSNIYDRAAQLRNTDTQTLLSEMTYNFGTVFYPVIT